MLDVGFRGIQRQVATVRSCARKRVGLRQGLYIRKATVAGNGPRLLAHKLHAIEIFRVVAGCYHNASIHFGVTGREIDFLSAAHADVIHIHTLLPQAVRQRCLDRFTRQADVVTYNYLLRFNHLGIGTTYAPRNILIQLVGNASTDIVGLETVELLHAANPHLLL